MTDAADHCSRQPAISRRKRSRISLPVRRVDDLGVELDPVEAALGVLEGGDRRARARGERAEARRRLEDGVAVAHPALLALGQARRSGGRRRRAATARCGRTPPARRASTRPPRLVDHRLHAVTDAEHRDAELEQLVAQLGRARLVDRGRARRRARAPAAGAARIRSRSASCGSSSAKTPHSRMRRAISCEYWPPKSRTRTSSRSTVDAAGRAPSSSTSGASIASPVSAGGAASATPALSRRRPRRPLETAARPFEPIPTDWLALELLALGLERRARPSPRRGGRTGCPRSRRSPSRSAARPSG